jgi:hypothetical protein
MRKKLFVQRVEGKEIKSLGAIQRIPSGVDVIAPQKTWMHGCNFCLTKTID